MEKMRERCMHITTIMTLRLWISAFDMLGDSVGQAEASAAANESLG